MKIVGHILVFIGLILIVTLRVLAFNLTEGQALVQYLPYWILSVGLIFGGIGIQNNSK